MFVSSPLGVGLLTGLLDFCLFSTGAVCWTLLHAGSGARKDDCMKASPAESLTSPARFRRPVLPWIHWIFCWMLLNASQRNTFGWFWIHHSNSLSLLLRWCTKESVQASEDRGLSSSALCHLQVRCPQSEFQKQVSAYLVQSASELQILWFGI